MSLPVRSVATEGVEGRAEKGAKTARIGSLEVMRNAAQLTLLPRLASAPERQRMNRTGHWMRWSRGGSRDVAAARVTAFVLIACAAFAGPVAASADETVPSLLTKAHWLVGAWQGEGLGGVVEEVWLPPAGGAMVGVFRLLRGGKVDFYELMTIVETEVGLEMRLKHFKGDLVGWEEKDDSVIFPAKSVTDTSIVFEGLEIERKGEGLVEQRVVIGTKDGAEPQVAVFSYRRVELTGAP